MILWNASFSDAFSITVPKLGRCTLKSWIYRAGWVGCSFFVVFFCTHFWYHCSNMCHQVDVEKWVSLVACYWYPAVNEPASKFGQLNQELLFTMKFRYIFMIGLLAAESPFNQWFWAQSQPAPLMRENIGTLGGSSLLRHRMCLDQFSGGWIRHKAVAQIIASP